MTGETVKAAWILALGLIITALIIAITMVYSTSNLSKSLIVAGERSRSHHSASQFPNELRVEVSEASKDLLPERRTELMEAFINACVGQVYENKTIKDVKVREFNAKYWGSNLDFKGDIVFTDGTLYEDFVSHLYRNGFGGYEGFVRTKDGNHLIIKNVHIK